MNRCRLNRTGLNNELLIIRSYACDGCGESKKFDMNHYLDRKKGGLVTAQHDEIRDELRDLLAHVFSPSRIRCEPMTNPAPMRADGTKTHVPSASSSSTS